MKPFSLSRFEGLFPLLITLLLCAIVFGRFAFADDPTQPLPDSSFWTGLLEFVKSLKNGTALTIVAAFVQLSIVFFRTSFGNFAGVYKLLTVLGLAVVYTFLMNLMRGMPLLDSLLDGTVVTAVMVFVNELMKHLKQEAGLVPVSRRE